jgi:hypothetical protein
VWRCTLVGSSVSTFIHLWDLHVTGYLCRIAASALIENHGKSVVSCCVTVITVRREFGRLSQ